LKKAQMIALIFDALILSLFSERSPLSGHNGQ